MRAGLGIGVDRHCSCPDLFGTGSCMVDRGRAVHAGGLRGIRIERIAGNDLDAVFAPIDGLMAVIVPVVMLMFMIDAHDVPFGRERFARLSSAAAILYYAKSFKNKENCRKFIKRLFKSRLIYRLDQVT